MITGVVSLDDNAMVTFYDNQVLSLMIFSNQALFERTCRILKTFIEKRERSKFVRQMVQETDTDIDRMTALLDCVLIGLKDRSKDE